MTPVRKIVAGVVCLVGFSVVTVGCGKGESAQPRAKASAPAAPQSPGRAALVATIPHFDTESFTYKFAFEDSDEGPSRTMGGSDPNAKQRAMSVRNELFDFDYIIVGSDRFLKIAGHEGARFPLKWLDGVPKGWMKLDARKVGAGADQNLLEQLVPRNAAKVFNHTAQVRDAGGGKYTGTIDLTQSLDSMLVNDHNLKEYGAKAKAVPFEATTDGKGRLTSLRLTVVPGEDSMNLTFANWGLPVKMSVPSARKVTEAPPALYFALSNT